MNCKSLHQIKQQILSATKQQLNGLLGALAQTEFPVGTEVRYRYTGEKEDRVAKVTGYLANEMHMVMLKKLDGTAGDTVACWDLTRVSEQHPEWLRDMRAEFERVHPFDSKAAQKAIMDSLAEMRGRGV